MLTPSSEQNRDKKRDDGAEADPPRKREHREPARLSIQLRTEDTGDAIRQPTQYRDDDEADDHSDDVSKIVAAAFGKNSAEKDPEQRAISVTEDSQRNRDDPHIGMHNHEIGSGRGNYNHQESE